MQTCNALAGFHSAMTQKHTESLMNRIKLQLSLTVQAGDAMLDLYLWVGEDLPSFRVGNPTSGAVPADISVWEIPRINGRQATIITSSFNPKHPKLTALSSVFFLSILYYDWTVCL